MRQHIFVENDSQWSQIPIPPGCSIAFVPMSSHVAGQDTFHQAIATAIGVPTATQLFTDPRCVVIDSTNTVISVIMADAGIDKIQNMTLINHQTAQIGHTYNPATQQFTAPGYTLPAKTGVRATAVVVPPTTFT